jgi:Tfp pilus assembly protein PilN
MKKILKAMVGGVVVLGVAALVGVNIYLGNWAMACSLSTSVLLYVL